MLRPPPRRRAQRALAIVAGVLVAAILSGAAAGVWTVRRSFPQIEGTVALDILDGAVAVHRDEYGVPQIYADDALDLFRGQGYVHAQDRFWEMDFRRHLTAGRLAEMFGASQLQTDAFIRTLGWRRVAEQELDLLEPATVAYLEAYAEGVNAYLDQRSGAELSLEYALLGLQNSGYQPEPWEPADSLAWLKAMAWDLRGNMQSEIDRVQLSQVLPRDRVEQLYPPYPYDRHAPILDTSLAGGGETEASGTRLEELDTEPADDAPELPQEAQASLYRVEESVAALQPLFGPEGEGIGSNSWVVAGEHTSSGRPLLANDPHLSPAIPSTWYQVGLHCRDVDENCPFDVAGFSFSGLPGVVIGHNDTIAWGLANLGADVSDLYVERLAGDGDTYAYDGAQLPIRTREEVIEVAGDEPVTLQVRSTRHGPLLSDVDRQLREVARAAPAPDGGELPADIYAIALAWTALTPGRTADALFGFNKARSWEQFRTAAGSFEVPAQSLVYADVRGQIGYQASGAVPVRNGFDGRWPVPGWDSRYDWVGTVPFEAMPSALNPEEGFIVAANQAPTRPDYPAFLSEEWAYGYRSDRIAELLSSRIVADEPVQLETMVEIQRDTRNGFADVLAAQLLEVEVDDFTAEARLLLRGADGDQPASSSSAAYYNAVWRHLLRLTFHDELPLDARPSGGGRWWEVVRELLREPTDPWWDDVATEDVVETRDIILEQAMVDARLELTRELGKEPRDWTWGGLHALELRHATFGQSGIAPVEAMFNRGPLALGGGAAIVQATGWTATDGYAVDWVPSMRMVVDLAELDRSRWVNLTGASGHAYHPHYADQIPLWVDGRTTAWPFTPAAVEDGTEHLLELVPEAGPDRSPGGPLPSGPSPPDPPR